MTDTRLSGEVIRFPEQFLGIFERNRDQFAPLLRAAREDLRGLEVPAVVRANYDYAVLEHAQPSFMLLPMMYLAMAEHAGGITERHRRYLPLYMLAMELVAVLDDTVDRTPYRSGRETYPRRFGECSATSFSCFLLNTILVHTASRSPEVLPLVTGLFGPLCALQTWEYHARYPDPTPRDCARWLQRHYDAVTPAVAHSLDSALALHNLPAVPLEVCTRFGEIMQDVDDIVNLVEHRDQAGENDDLEMGIVTHPLLATIEASPKTYDLVQALWTRFREPAGERQSAPQWKEDAAAERRALNALVMKHGVPTTMRKIVADAHACIEAAPAELRPCVSEMTLTFVDRLRGLDGLPGVLVAA